MLSQKQKLRSQQAVSSREITGCDKVDCMFGEKKQQLYTVRLTHLRSVCVVGHSGGTQKQSVLHRITDFINCT